MSSRASLGVSSVCVGVNKEWLMGLAGELLRFCLPSFLFFSSFSFWRNKRLDSRRRPSILNATQPIIHLLPSFVSDTGGAPEDIVWVDGAFDLETRWGGCVLAGVVGRERRG